MKKQPLKLAHRSRDKKKEWTVDAYFVGDHLAVHLSPGYEDSKEMKWQITHRETGALVSSNTVLWGQPFKKIIELARQADEKGGDLWINCDGNTQKLDKLFNILKDLGIR
jgi:hypothetical protein